jgi:ABC-2 type transport system permease protein
LRLQSSARERDQKALYLQRHHITNENPTITVSVDEAPDEAGFDPYNKLIDRVSTTTARRSLCSDFMHQTPA